MNVKVIMSAGMGIDLLHLDLLAQVQENHSRSIDVEEERLLRRIRVGLPIPVQEHVHRGAVALGLATENADVGMSLRGVGVVLAGWRFDGGEREGRRIFARFDACDE